MDGQQHSERELTFTFAKNKPQCFHKLTVLELG